MKNNRNGKKIELQKLLAPLVLVVLTAFFLGICVMKDVSVVRFVLSVLESVYFIGFIALGMTFVIATGGIDLSAGTVMICAAMFGGVAIEMWKWNIVAALLLCVAVGMIFGVANGFLVAKLKLPAFIATLATMMVSQSVSAIISNVQTMRYPAVGSDGAWFKLVFVKSGRIPSGIFWLAAFTALAMFLLYKTRLGKYTMAIGSNAEAARLSGVNTESWLWKVYIVHGFFVGLAAIFYAATFTAIVPSSGSGNEMNAIAGVVIGGTSLSGGAGFIGGTIIGVLIMGVLKTGLMAMGVKSEYQLLFTGVVVLLAVLMDRYRQNALNKLKK